jgi:small-conductance mechanosensitive channel
VAAKITDVVVTRVVHRLTRRTSTDLDDKVIAILHRPIFGTVVLIGLYFATGVLGLDPGPRQLITVVIQTLAVLIWTVTGLRLASTLIGGLGRLADQVQWIEARTVPLFDNLAKVLLVGGAVYFLLIVWGLDVKPWLASAGIIGIALGFAAKDTLANLFGGLFVIVDAPYKIGDFINLDSGQRGQVTSIGLRSTRLLTRNDVEITVPNAQIANATIVNESGGPWVKSRVTIYVGVAYGSDVDQVREVLMRAARSVEQVLDDPAPRVRFTELGDSALIFRVLCWIEEPALRGQAVDGLNSAIYKGLGAEGISIPFPQRELHIRQQPADEGGD